MARFGGLLAGARVAAHAAFFLLMGVVFVLMVAVGVFQLLDRDRPTFWGTFTETATDCTLGARGGCEQTGTWVSDDGSRVEIDIRLDGSVERGQSVRASFRPGGFMGDDENDIVHTEGWSDAGLWLPWVLAAATGGLVWTRLRVWRDDARGRGHLSRHGSGSRDAPHDT